jgi:Cu(I)/Ag(I) efflux system periplasmic protein CusF
MILSTELNVPVNKGMKLRATLLLITLTVSFGLACRQPQQTATPVKPTPTPQNLSGPPGLPTPIMNKPYPGTGVVAQVNRNEGWVEIDHEEIKDLMPAMQMEFNVKDKSLLNEVKAGDKVNFTIVETEKGEFLTAIKKASAP